MIISHKYKFVFIHIPKTAGTFVTELLLSLDKDAINLYSDDNNGHQTFFLIKQMKIYDTIKNYTFFTIIRNPIDKLISWYNFTKNYESFSSMLEHPDVVNGCTNNIYLYTLHEHNITNDPKIILIKLENLKEQLLILFKQLNIDTTNININSFFENKINVSDKLFTKENLKQNNETTNIIKNKILNNKALIEELYYYNLYT